MAAPSGTTSTLQSEGPRLEANQSQSTGGDGAFPGAPPSDNTVQPFARTGTRGCPCVLVRGEAGFWEEGHREAGWEQRRKPAMSTRGGGARMDPREPQPTAGRGGSLGQVTVGSHPLLRLPKKPLVRIALKPVCLTLFCKCGDEETRQARSFPPSQGAGDSQSLKEPRAQ